MKKFLATTAIALSALTAAPAFAQSSSSSTSSSSSSVSSTASSADLTCMSAAVDVRENAVINARTSYNAAVLAAMTTRRTSLHAAFSITNNKDRAVALVASWDAFLKATAQARVQYKTSVEAAWSAFVATGTTCNIDTDRGPLKTRRNDDRHDDKKDDKDNRGWHLGWAKQAIKRAAKDAKPDVQAEAKLKANVKAGSHIDLSL